MSIEWIDRAEASIGQAHHSDPESLGVVVLDLESVRRCMCAAEYFDYEHEALYAHLLADTWRWEALARQRTVRSEHVRGVRGATLGRLKSWRSIVMEFDTPARQAHLERIAADERARQQRAHEWAEEQARRAAAAAMQAEALAVLEGEARALQECSYCGARPGDWCVRPATGHPTGRVHAVRSGALASSMIACPHCSTSAGQPCNAVDGTTHGVRRVQAGSVLIRDQEQAATLAEEQS